jgi:hypothetical protein
MKNKLIAVALAAASVSGCAMTVDNMEYASFADQGYDVVIARNTSRDPLMMWDDTLDRDEVWATNRMSIPMCVGLGRNGAAVSEHWTIPAGRSVQLFRYRITDNASWSIHPQYQDPNCSTW